jgi:hypothetical protein
MKQNTGAARGARFAIRLGREDRVGSSSRSKREAREEGSTPVGLSSVPFKLEEK